MNQAIGILGGTFDPIHHGHLRMALELQHKFNLKQVYLVPSYLPVHRALPTASAEARFHMVELAVAEENKLIASPIETNNHNLSYTIDTLIYFRTHYGDLPLCLLLGMDAFIGFLDWHRHEQILNYAHILVAHRPDYSLPINAKLNAFIEHYTTTDKQLLYNKPAGHIFFSPINALAISASAIRKNFLMDENPRYLIPETVYDYIKQHNIYSGKKPC